MGAIVVVGAARTPVGAFNGAFASVAAHELGAVAIREALARAHVEGAEVDEVILGQILTAGQGQNPARQASMAAGCPAETTAWGLNQLCGSGLRAIALGLQQIRNGIPDRGGRWTGMDRAKFGGETNKFGQWNAKIFIKYNHAEEIKEVFYA